VEPGAFAGRIEGQETAVKRPPEATIWRSANLW
jgi:hypothetical protein